MSLFEVYFPNSVTIQDTYSADTAFHILATDGSGYASLAALKAAGKIPFPNLEPGQPVGRLLVRSIATGGTAAGSPFYFQLNPQGTTINPTPPVQGSSPLVDGSGQTLSGGYGFVNQVWIAKTVSSDLVEVRAEY